MALDRVVVRPGHTQAPRPAPSDDRLHCSSQFVINERQDHPGSRSLGRISSISLVFAAVDGVVDGLGVVAVVGKEFLDALYAALAGVLAA